MPTAAVLLLVAQVHAASAEEWSRFRGPGGSGVLESANLPVEVGTDRNVRWKVALPSGHSSPVVGGGRVFLTAFEQESLVTLGVRAEDGKTFPTSGSSPTPATETSSGASPSDRSRTLIFATPALSGDRIYLRTPTSLYCFARK
jgi:outer membrane protein assembly factor BamB